MEKFKLDYTQIEHDSNVVKNFIINKVKEFDNFESFEKYVKKSDMLLKRGGKCVIINTVK